MADDFEMGSPAEKPDARRRNPLLDAKDVPPPKPRKKSGWADEGSSGFLRFRRQSSTRPPQSTIKNEPPRAPKTETVLDRDDESDAETAAIPDLDEVQERDLATQIARAPSTRTNEASAFRQLDDAKRAAFAKLDDVDLRGPTAYLCPEEDLREPDAVWTRDVLFTEVTADCRGSDSGGEA